MSAAPLATPTGFEVLDACHQQILEHLMLLSELTQRIEAEGVDSQAQQVAAAVEAFFSGTSRQHHLEEEKNVFPLLLSSGNAELVALVRVMQQDHGWIEENWLELAPQLRAMASGNAWVHGAEFQHNADVFLTLCRSHIELEEKMIYPEAKASRARSVASRLARVPL